MKLSALTPRQMGQLAVAIAEILTYGVTTCAETDAISHLLSAVRENVHFYSLAIKKDAGKSPGGHIKQ